MTQLTCDACNCDLGPEPGYVGTTTCGCGCTYSYDEGISIENAGSIIRDLRTANAQMEQDRNKWMPSFQELCWCLERVPFELLPDLLSHVVIICVDKGAFTGNDLYARVAASKKAATGPSEET